MITVMNRESEMASSAVIIWRRMNMKKNNDPDIDRPEAELLENPHRQVPALLHHDEHYRHGDKRYRKRKAEKKNVQRELRRGQNLPVLMVADNQ